LIPPFLPFRRGFFLRNVRWEKAQSDHGTGQTAEDQPHGPSFHR
jgi:hypothetical protein